MSFTSIKDYQQRTNILIHFVEISLRWIAHKNWNYPHPYLVEIFRKSIRRQNAETPLPYSVEVFPKTVADNCEKHLYLVVKTSVRTSSNNDTKYLLFRHLVQGHTLSLGLHIRAVQAHEGQHNDISE